MVRLYSFVLIWSCAWCVSAGNQFKSDSTTIKEFIASLPELDSLLIKTGSPEILKQKQISALNTNTEQILSSGTFFRLMDMSALSGSDVGGGLKFQLQGNLTDDIQVSGVLSDQNNPIRPQGDTKTIRDLDEVHLTVSHPNIRITAGDYILRMNSGKLLNINKNLVGIKSNFKYNNVTASAFFAGAKGNYHELKIKGMEGNQGPYILSGNGDIRYQTIVTGSEIVWLDGQKLIRGSQYDYTIDYSTGELYFEPKHLIYSDSDIFVEFESTDFHYRRNTAGSSLSLEKDGRIFEVNWIRDFDDPSTNGSLYSNSELNLLRSAGDSPVVISGAVEDPAGNYVMKSNYFLFDPDGIETGNRYRVTFSLDRSSGTYTREISSNGTLFYSFVLEDDRTDYIDLYSPDKPIHKPENFNLIHLRSGIPITQNQLFKLDIGLTQYDQNRLSNVGDDDNIGNAILLELTGEKINIGKGFDVDYSISNWQQGIRYYSLTRDRDVMFDRDWNMTGNESGNEILSKLSAEIHLPWNGSISSSFHQYSIGDIHKNRFQSGVNTKTKWIPELKGTFNSVKGKQDFYQKSIYIKALPGSYHPYVNYKSETRQNFDSWRTISGGLELDQNFSSFKVGFGSRNDLSYSELLRKMEEYQQAVFGEIDMSRKSKNGWTGAMQIRKRITENNLLNTESDISLAHIRTHFRKSNHPIRFDLKLKQESRLGSGRTMVYDSIGAGLGGYRYDEEFDAFIEDPNGNYSGFAVASGTRRSVKAIGLTEMFEIDFNRTRYEKLHGMKFRLNMTADLSGTNGKSTEWIFADIGSNSIERSRWMVRTEINSNPIGGKRQSRLTWLAQRDLNGLDARGIDITEHQEISSEWKKAINRHFRLTVNGSWADHQIESTISQFRNRSVTGGWIETGTEWKMNSEVELNTKIIGGSDSGMHQSQNFIANALGLKVGFVKRIGRIGRLRGEMIVTDSWMKEETTASLPPEALHGFALGKTFRTQLQAHFLFANSLSANLSVNTISDSRYENLINLRGEIRANF